MIFADVFVVCVIDPGPARGATVYCCAVAINVVVVIVDARRAKISVHKNIMNY